MRSSVPMLGARVTTVRSCPRNYFRESSFAVLGTPRCRVLLPSLALFIFFVVPVTYGSPRPPVYHPPIWEKKYLSKLETICPKKKLQLLSPSDLLDAGDSFRDSLPQHRRRAVISSIGWDLRHGARRCRHIIAGATCDASANVEGFYKTGLLDRFVGRICVSYKGCSSQSECETDPHAKGSLIDYPTGGTETVTYRGQRPVQIPPLPPLPH